MEKIYENEVAKFYHDKTKKIFRAEFFGVVSPERALEAFNYAIKNFHKYPTKAILSDLTHLRGTFTMLLDFFDAQLFPFLAANGVLCDAIVLNNDAFTTFSVYKMAQTINNVQIKSFNNEEEAMKWIENIINS